MPIKYRVAERTEAGVSGGGKKKYCVMPTGRKMIELQDISAEIQKMSTFSEADTVGVLYALMSVLMSHIQEGDSIRFGELGIFTVSFKSALEDNPSKVDSRSIKEVKLKFRPGVRIKKELKQCKFTKVRDKNK